jgi:excisionase family DNA binding protein
MPSDDEPECLSLVEAAEIFGVSPRTLERWARAGRIPSEVTRDGRRIFRHAEVVKRVVGLRRAAQDE